MSYTNTLTRADLAETMNRLVGLSRADSAVMVETILDHMIDALVDDRAAPGADLPRQPNDA